jgi:hypothetical protein
MSRTYSPRCKTAVSPFVAPRLYLRLLHRLWETMPVGPSGFTPGEWFCWRPPHDTEENERHSLVIVKSVKDRMMELCSPGPEMALTPFAPSRFPHHPHELWDTVPAKQHAVRRVIKMWNERS